MRDGQRMEEATKRITAVMDRVSEAVITDREFLETVSTGLLARGHVLLEDVPGTGKTLTAVALADALDLEFTRIQFTPDLLPSDITGSQIYNEEHGEFQFQRGPVFANIVLADEINRAPPKTQSALLEAMDEGQVTVGGTTYDLPEPFFVLATQNPIEQEGTFRLPEAQRDRFIVKTSIGYPDRGGEIDLISRRASRDTQMPTVNPVVDASQVTTLRQLPEQVSIKESVKEYLVDLARASRDDPRVDVGVSPRGIQRFFEASRAHALIDGRDYVTPDDIKAIARPVMTHRLVLTSEAGIKDINAEAIVTDLLDSVEVPGAATTAD
ncbi:MoxR-like ATPase [Halorubrum ezzemoulense]|uniref:MoxR-like ATPase n=1 Tax=Halorubrum ezzemoulense TaxID=337243 RepID=A0A238Z8V2_HALEZ|nr:MULTISPECIES: MoxR family ATPase [Halorubrum]TKX35648.1 MoxR family ATPase [Halorubrum sp. CGM4_25_10-8A]TKX61406.1 MoxR family ATPase [Halorubrum sp. GN12_10-3_MGM]SNR79401.1 MoxR-like ATPase [Halorubrum ezzemoulense]